MQSDKNNDTKEVIDSLQKAIDEGAAYKNAKVSVSNFWSEENNHCVYDFEDVEFRWDIIELD